MTLQSNNCNQLMAGNETVTSSKMSIRLEVNLGNIVDKIKIHFDPAIQRPSCCLYDDIKLAKVFSLQEILHILSHYNNTFYEDFM